MQTSAFRNLLAAINFALPQFQNPITSTPDPPIFRYSGSVPHVIYGIHAVEEAVRSRARSLDYVGVARERTNDARVKRLLEAARANHVIVRTVEREQIAKLARTDLHQGVVAVGGRFGYTDVSELLAHRRGEHAFLLVLDGIEDPTTSAPSSVRPMPPALTASSCPSAAPPA